MFYFLLKHAELMMIRQMGELKANGDAYRCRLFPEL